MARRRKKPGHWIRRKIGRKFAYVCALKTGKLTRAGNCSKR